MRNYCSSFSAPSIVRNTLLPDIKDLCFYWVDKFATIPERFINLPIPDPDLIIYRRNWIEGVAKNIRDKANLDNWVRASNTCNVPLGVNWLDMDELWLTAVSMSIDEFIKEQNKASSDHLQQMQTKLEALKPYQSPMDSIPKPTFY